ncbi:MAG: histidine kinase [Planctomycetota bacterium]
MRRLLRSFGSEPRPPAPVRSAFDVRLSVGIAAVMLVEAAISPEVGLGSPSLLLGLALAALIHWRRSHPLLVTAVAFGTTGVLEGIGLAIDRDVQDLHSMAVVLMLPYALFRWGSGREALLGLPIVLASAALGMASDAVRPAEVIGGFGVLLVPVALGIAARYREAARVRELVDVRTNERLNLARELHDTVAHHVSAIAVRAQAGVVTGAKDPAAATDALRVIRDEASRALSEMREMVRVLREDDAATLAPAPRVEDLAELAAGLGGAPEVALSLDGDTERLSPAISGAVYRLAQESVTNARRHARGASRVSVSVSVDDDGVRLRVEDDGEPTGRGAAPRAGFGLTGMAERAALLGGTLTAGPGPERGWTVAATLPHGGLGTAG